ncbi:hypothetical protein NL676_035306 [Syzygium grande]|nr:hypothetical protein NL676_035306 [Syzygium grande]
MRPRNETIEKPRWTRRAGHGVVGGGGGSSMADEESTDECESEEGGEQGDSDATTAGARGSREPGPLDLGARGDAGPWDCAHQLGIGMGFVCLGPGRTVVASARIAEHARGGGGWQRWGQAEGEAATCGKGIGHGSETGYQA